jgi:hypothetical protein
MILGLCSVVLPTFIKRFVFIYVTKVFLRKNVNFLFYSRNLFDASHSWWRVKLRKSSLCFFLHLWILGQIFPSTLCSDTFSVVILPVAWHSNFLTCILRSLSCDRSTVLSNGVLHRVQSSASCFKFQYLLFSFRSTSSCLRLLFRLLVTCIFPLCFFQQRVLEASSYARYDQNNRHMLSVM